MASIAIVFHSGNGHTAAVAESLRTGAAEVAGAGVTLITVSKEGTITDAEWAALDAADATRSAPPATWAVRQVHSKPSSTRLRRRG